MLDTEQTVGEMIFRLRKERGWTQKELADLVEMHPNHVSRMETNKMQPRRSTLEKLAEVFQLNVEDLLTLAGINGRDLSQRLAEEDPDLAALMSQVPLLQNEQKEALRVFLRSMLTCHRLQSLASGNLA